MPRIHPLRSGMVNKRWKTLRSPAWSRQRNAIFPPLIHQTWPEPFSGALYTYTACGFTGCHVSCDGNRMRLEQKADLLHQNWNWFFSAIFGQRRQPRVFPRNKTHTLGSRLKDWSCCNPQVPWPSLPRCVFDISANFFSKASQNAILRRGMACL